MGIIQQEVKQQLANTTLKAEQCIADQRFIAQQVKANGQAVAQLTLRQFEREAGFVSDGSVVADNDTMFENVFAKGKTNTKPEHSHQFKHMPPPKKDNLPHHSLPKMHFPYFDGVQPKIWLDKCNNYFSIYSIAETLWVEAATMHLLQDNAAKWWQTYKLNHPAVTWKQFTGEIQEKFGSDDYKSAINELLDLKQTSTVEEYTTQFQSLQYGVSMHSCWYDALFFATEYVRDLRDDIRVVVEPQVPTTVERETIIAKIQQKILDRQKLKYQNRNAIAKAAPARIEAKTLLTMAICGETDN